MVKDITHKTLLLKFCFLFLTIFSVFIYPTNIWADEEDNIIYGAEYNKCVEKAGNQSPYALAGCIQDEINKLESNVEKIYSRLLGILPNNFKSDLTRTHQAWKEYIKQSCDLWNKLENNTNEDDKMGCLFQARILWGQQLQSMYNDYKNKN
ncbi:MAG: lysozyme inhibitor LprI family protein [Alphaproteobacteria bacterium]|nr:lysozyme inhibitor LprI family protein [Alphaproteobacteria bacterium]